MNFGLPEKSMSMIVGALSGCSEIEQAAIFGSRAAGNYKRGSDVDLVIYGYLVTGDIVSRLSCLLNEELPLPYFFDILHYESISNEQLKSNIDVQAKLIYVRKR